MTKTHRRREVDRRREKMGSRRRRKEDRRGRAKEAHQEREGGRSEIEALQGSAQMQGEDSKGG